MGKNNKIKKIIKYILKGAPDFYTKVEVNVLQPNKMQLEKNIVITGGGRGLGYYIAKRCIDEGANVVITGRNEETLIESCKKLGNRCKYVVYDVQNINGISDFFKLVEEKFDGNKINSLVSNAGISLHEKSFREVTEDGWDRQLDVNLKGNFFIVKEFIKYLESKSDTKGNIIVITSERAKRPDQIPYGITKAGANSFIQGIAAQVINENIRINGIAPGVTASDMTGFSKDENLYAEWQPTKRIFLPEEVAEVVNFLLSDISGCISGEIITCDQGRYIMHW